MSKLNYGQRRLCHNLFKQFIIYRIILAIDKYMTTEYITLTLFNIFQDIEQFSGPCHKIKDYPSKGFVFVLKSNDLLSNFVK